MSSADDKEKFGGGVGSVSDLAVEHVALFTDEVGVIENGSAKF